MGPGRPKVVLTDYVWDSLEIEEQMMASVGAEFIALQCKSQKDLLSVASGATALLNTYFGPIDRGLLQSLPHLKLIARYGIGVDTIDVGAATELGVIVTNNPTYCLDEVTDHTLALLLACGRRIAFYDREVRAGHWDVERAKPIYRLAGKTLGLIGLGNIGRKVAQKAKAFDLKVLYYDPYVPPEVGEGYQAEKASLDRVLKEADFLSVHIPLTAETRHLIDVQALRQMKKSAFLINASRGPVVSTEGLVQALRGGWIAGAALDVIEGVPPFPAGHPLRGFPNVIFTPHSAWYSEEALVGLHQGAPTEVVRFLKGERPLHVVNPEVLAKVRPGP